jgi:hypothetical protein
LYISRQYFSSTDRNRLERDLRRIPRESPTNLIYPFCFREWYGTSWFGPVVILSVLLLLAYMVGQGEAMRKERFLLLKWSHDVVILRTYGDTVIAARFDRTQKLVSDELMLMRLGTDQKWEFLNQAVGPLTVEKSK